MRLKRFENNFVYTDTITKEIKRKVPWKEICGGLVAGYLLGRTK